MIRPRADGPLFAFEGPDGVGKSTIVRATGQILRSRGVDVREGAFPGNEAGSLGRLVYQLHHNPSEFGIRGIATESLQLLHVAAHIDAIESWIEHARQKGTTILLDRFWWSTAVYAAVTGMPNRTIRAILGPELLYWRRSTPDAVFLITRDNIRTQEGLNRDHAELSAAYARLAKAESFKSKVIRIANDDTIESAATHVAAHIGSICAS